MERIVVNRIKHFRDQAGLTQKELGKLLDIDFTTVSKHENAQKPIPEQTLIAYAAVFKVQTHELFFDPTNEK